MTDLAKLVVTLEAETAAYQAKLELAERKLREFQEDGESRLGKFALGIAGFAAAAGVAFAALVGHAINAADEMNDLSKSTGISTEALSQLKFAAEQSGTDLDSVVQGLKKLGTAAVSAAKGSTAQVAAFGQLGVSVKDANGELKGTEQLLLETAEVFSQYEDGVGKTAIATELFGKAGNKLIPFLNEGKDGIEKLKARADELGLTLSGSAAQAADDFNDKLNELKAAVTGIGTQAARQLLPVLNNIASAFIETAAGEEAIAAASAGLTTALKFVVDVGFRVYQTFKQAGEGLGALGAAAVAAAHGNFSEAIDILKARNEDYEKDAKSSAEFLDHLWNGTLEDVLVTATKVDEGLKKTFVFGGSKGDGLEKLSATVKKMTEDMSEPLADFYDRLDHQTQTSTEKAIDSYHEQEAALKILYANATISADQFAERHNELLDETLTEQRSSVGYITKEIKAKTDEITAFEKKAAENTQDIISDALDNGFSDGADGILRTFGEMLRKLANQAIAANVAKYLFGNPGETGDSGGLLGAGIKAATAYFGGGRAGGGPVRAGHAYDVGEMGPERFVPDRPGRIVPNDRWASGGTVNVYNSIQAPNGTVSRQTQVDLAARTARAITLASRRNN